jgi:hypothetical protein
MRNSLLPFIDDYTGVFSDYHELIAFNLDSKLALLLLNRDAVINRYSHLGQYNFNHISKIKMNFVLAS